jgi:hypothetical protein
MLSSTTMIHLDSSEITYSCNAISNVHAFALEATDGESKTYVTLFMSDQQLQDFAAHVQMYADDLIREREGVTL